jgi:hypothetical protein
MKNILLVMLTLLFFQCNSNKTNKPVNADEYKFFVIDYEKALQNKKTINLSEMAEEVKYIPLQTDSNCLLGRKPEYHFTDQYIFIENRDHVLVYDYNGKYLRRIGTPGKGPNEIDLIRMIQVNDKDKTVAIQTNWNRKILFFNFDGTFKESVPVPDVMYMYPIENDKFVAYDFCSSGYEDYVLRLTNRKNDTISRVNNHFKWENKTGTIYSIGYWGFHPMYSNNDNYFFKGMYNDTIYYLSDNKFMPAYYVDLGQYRLPNDSRFENPVSMEKFRRVQADFFFASTLEAGNQIFLTTINYDESITKNILLRRNASEGAFLVKEFAEPSGLINDWDGGPDFWPEGNVNDQTVFMPVSAFALKDMIEEDGFGDKYVNHPDQKKALVDMAKGLKEEDNAVLMVVKLRIK